MVGIEHEVTITHDVYWFGEYLEHSHASENDTLPIPEFLPKGSPNCPRGRTDLDCVEEENYHTPASFPSSFLSSGANSDF